jgi:hypothetical protein
MPWIHTPRSSTDDKPRFIDTVGTRIIRYTRYHHQDLVIPEGITFRNEPLIADIEYEIRYLSNDDDLTNKMPHDRDWLELEQNNTQIPHPSSNPSFLDRIFRLHQLYAAIHTMSYDGIYESDPVQQIKPVFSAHTNNTYWLLMLCYILLIWSLVYRWYISGRSLYLYTTICLVFLIILVHFL